MKDYVDKLYINVDEEPYLKLWLITFFIEITVVYFLSTKSY